ncbi:MAG: DUF1080 domain-containing protein [Kiritimatiellae bacterium]|nr:DUF1080 domain-containing protein [Kiritimatiellia bacterium]
MKTASWFTLAAICALSLSATAATEVKTVPIRPTAKTVLFNGKDFSGWTKVITAEPGSSVDTTWQVVDGVIRCTGAPMGYIVTQQSFTDYKLTVEYRWYDRAKNMNSGVFVHKTGPDTFFLPCAIESQLKMGDAGDFVLLSKASVNGIKNDNIGSVKKFKDSSEKPFGEWNRVEITVKGRTIDIFINGVHQNHGENATADAGQICLQSEGGPIEFRNVFIEPIQ